MKDVLKDKFSSFLDGWIRSSTIAALFLAVFSSEDYFQKEQRRHYFSAGIPSIVLSVFFIDILANSQWDLIMITWDHLKSGFCAKITFVTIGLYFIYAVFQEIIWNRSVNEA